MPPDGGISTSPTMNVSANSRAPSGEVQPRRTSPRGPARHASFGSWHRNCTWHEREVQRALRNLEDRFDRMASSSGDAEAAGTRKTPGRWRYTLLDRLNSVPLHNTSTVLLCADLILVVMSLELYIQTIILKGRAVENCLQEYESFQATPLPLADTNCNTRQLYPCDPSHSEEFYVAKVLGWAELIIASLSCLILLSFLIKSMLYIVVLGVSFFKSFFFIFDLLVVIISLSLELWTVFFRSGEQLIVGFLIVVRMWRFLRVPRQVHVLDYAEAAISNAERASLNPTPQSHTPASTISSLPHPAPNNATRPGSGATNLSPPSSVC
mmetsp:Transcript_5394/g.15021  ORF Transcript_5394/g.15021 Transcript_5394/m.15021 type:complete len:324 (+) Transcript_5394:374-1345(+)